MPSKIRRSDVSNRSRPLASRRQDHLGYRHEFVVVSNRSRPLASRRTNLHLITSLTTTVSNRSRPLASRRESHREYLASYLKFPIDRVP